MQKRIAAIGVLIVGIILIVVPITADLFTVAPAFEDLTDGFRETVMSDEAIAQSQADVAALGAVGAEFQSVVVPTLASALEMPPDGFVTFVGEQFPAVAAGVEALPAIATQFTDVNDLIASQQGNFQDADDIPNGALPVTTVPWAILGLGVLTVVVAAFMWVRGRNGAMAAVVLGVLVVAGALLFSLVGKSGAADDLNDAFKPVYTEELVTQSQGALQVVGAMGAQMQTGMLPALAQQLGMSGDQVQAFVGQHFPATAGALATFDEALGRFEATVGAFDAQLDNYDTIKNTSLTPIAWTVLLGGVVIALLGGWALFARREAAGSAAGKDEPPAKT